ncbi:hypothetical protein [Streptomyces sp. NPDC060031]|uniref:hypothetical protein n=1 Tax=Streptomyces sp. NPDC060031 TaxID=3347043 RepID=UPI00369B9749
MSRSVFDPLPDEGRWGTALLIDGNIGIGGAPRRLPQRVREVVAPEGLLLVETTPGDVDERRRVRIHSGHRPVSTVFPWAVAERWTSARGRHFVALRACR